MGTTGMTYMWLRRQMEELAKEQTHILNRRHSPLWRHDGRCSVDTLVHLSDIPYTS
jgi:hypothetical protein